MIVPLELRSVGPEGLLHCKECAREGAAVIRKEKREWWAKSCRYVWRRQMRCEECCAPCGAWCVECGVAYCPGCVHVHESEAHLSPREKRRLREDDNREDELEDDYRYYWEAKTIATLARELRHLGQSRQLGEEARHAHEHVNRCMARW